MGREQSVAERDAIANRAIGAGVNAVEDYANGDAMALNNAVGWFSIAYWNLDLNQREAQPTDP